MPEPDDDVTRQFPVRRPVTIRWSDIDMYGHVNNAVYYQWFDAAINGWLGEAAGVDPTAAEAIGVVGESACSFESEIGWGDEVSIGVAVSAPGSSSITYVLAAFNETTGQRGALAHWVHVYVAREGGGTVAVPEPIAAAARSITSSVTPPRMRKLQG